MKPFWNAATPDWANYLVQNEDGSWWWFAHKPKANLHGWTSSSGRYCRATGNTNWEQTLEKRPEGLTSETR